MLTNEPVLLQAARTVDAVSPSRRFIDISTEAYVLRAGELRLDTGARLDAGAKTTTAQAQDR